MSHQVLFLCTGNYYRSRFAEIVFNTLATKRHLDWRADSRGVAVEGKTDNVGPISEHALQALRARGNDLGNDIRFPLQLQERDLERADLIVAVNEPEHRPPLAQRFPQWTDKVVYWQIPDLDAASAEEGLRLVEQEVTALVERLVKK